MKAFLILEDGTVFEGTHIGADKEIISEIVFNTSMAGYLEVLTDPSYAGQAVCMTYPLIGNYGICSQLRGGRYHIFFLAGHLFHDLACGILLQLRKYFVQVIGFVGGDHAVHGTLLTQDLGQRTGIDTGDTGHTVLL